MKYAVSRVLQVVCILLLPVWRHSACSALCLYCALWNVLSEAYSMRCVSSFYLHSVRLASASTCTDSMSQAATALNHTLWHGTYWLRA